MPEDAAAAVAQKTWFQTALESITLYSLISVLTRHSALFGIIGAAAYYGADAYADNLIARKGLVQQQQVQAIQETLDQLQTTSQSLSRTIDQIDTSNKSVKTTTDQIRTDQREIQNDIKDILKILSTRSGSPQ